MKQKIISILCVVILVVVWFFFIRPVPMQSPTTPSNDVLFVTSSFYPLAYFAQRVGGERVVVTNLTPPGTEPHEYEPTPRAIARVFDSDLFIYNGGGVDAWASKLASDLQTSGVDVIQMSSHIDTLIVPEKTNEDERFDEHFWLDPNQAIIEVEVIADALINLDASHADLYITRSMGLINELKQLHARYTSVLTTCKMRTVIASHEAFGYLSRAYNFHAISLSGLSPHSELSSGALKSVVDEARKTGVSYIFFETLVSPEVADTIAKEIGAQTLVFNPVEGLTQAEFDHNETYFSIMEKNLQALKTAMACQNN